MCLGTTHTQLVMWLPAWSWHLKVQDVWLDQTWLHLVLLIARQQILTLFITQNTNFQTEILTVLSPGDARSIVACWEVSLPKAGGLEPHDPSGPFPPSPLCDSVIAALKLKGADFAMVAHVNGRDTPAAARGRALAPRRD